MCIGHGRLCVCMSVCLCLAAFPHYCSDPDVTWRNGSRFPLVVHFWVNLQSVHGFRCYDNIASNAKFQRVLVYSLYAWFNDCDLAALLRRLLRCVTKKINKFNSNERCNQHKTGCRCLTPHCPHLNTQYAVTGYKTSFHNWSVSSPDEVDSKSKSHILVYQN